ncbi:MAG: hypothetical protein D6748_06250 [Calditrichaeota bacterium]|nr:MAG: hypothetical protein D6748_06250 [Calditrichota bacterium]
MASWEELDNFYKAFSEFEEEVDIYCQQLIDILYQIITHLSSKDREYIRKVVSTLQVNKRDFKRQRDEVALDPTENNREELHRLEIHLVTIINDLRDHEVIRKFREKLQEQNRPSNNRIGISPTADTAITGVSTISLPTNKPQQDITPTRSRDEIIDTAFRIVDKILPPDATPMERLQEVERLVSRTIARPVEEKSVPPRANENRANYMH